VSAPPTAIAEALLPGRSAPILEETDFLDLLQNLFPRGRAWAWKDDPSSVGYGLLDAIALSEAQAHQDYLSKLADSPIGQLAQMVPEWQQTLGLPDPCVGPDASFELEVQHIMARLENRGGQSVPYLIAYALALGYVITITEFTPRRFGRARFGTRFWGDAWAHALQINGAPITVTPRRFTGRFGERYATWGNSVLLCELKRVAPAQAILIFTL